MATFFSRQGPADYYWSDTENTHRTRNREMLKAHGAEIKKLYGPDPSIRYLFTPFILLQIYLGYHAKDMGWPTLLLIAYFVGGTITHSSFLVIHELSHCLCFTRPFYNDLYAMFVNLVVPLPYAMMFKTYHAEHHRYLGWDRIDSDLPTRVEGRCLSSYVGKFIFVTFQVLFYAFRPTVVRRIKLQKLHVMNYTVQLTFNLLVYYFWGGWPLLYFLMCTFLGTSWHPLSGHFISEHFVFTGNGEQETFSYYGPLNWLAWNAGYHVEHHDFPNIPWTRIAQLNTIAPEFYVDLHRTKSWPATLFNFLLDANVNLCSRVVRERGAAGREKLLPTSTGRMRAAEPHKGPCSWKESG
ncbi:sphingolipid delta 4 desaturase, putative [Leishmania tarentolae]|uniref:sphingolipid 4-desaturase n=1 Tax=Leishmania tarentolae TaxID=5689 RepID=A0A640KJW7_LEITA|nr:sphingolipid delta 4 desaturase, putative [Leishmania tarentolae]